MLTRRPVSAVSEGEDGRRGMEGRSGSCWLEAGCGCRWGVGLPALGCVIVTFCCPPFFLLCTDCCTVLRECGKHLSATRHVHLGSQPCPWLGGGG